VLSFHEGVEEMLMIHVEKATSNVKSADAVLSAVDAFCYSRHWMMHVGDAKGKILDEAVQQAFESIPAEQQHRVCAIELGSYCGYSAVRIARLLPAAVRLISVDTESRCRGWTERLLRAAALNDKVDVHSSLSSAIEYIRSCGFIVAFVFIDHAKEQYVPDLIILEQSGLFRRPGCVIVADNIYSFGITLQDYLDHVSPAGGVYGPTVIHRCVVEYSTAGATEQPEVDAWADGVAISEAL
jgi:catechol O-methyltransferase